MAFINPNEHVPRALFYYALFLFNFQGSLAIQRLRCFFPMTQTFHCSGLDLL